MWLQRDYIGKEFPDYDPTSDRDEDLPIDLDHIIPKAIFRFDWRSREQCLEGGAQTENFRWTRDVVGNSLGNFRWLDAQENRGRQAGEYQPNSSDLVTHAAEWNRIIEKRPWSKDDIGTFQRLIDLRTLDLYENLLTESGVYNILPLHARES